ncbi:MAG: ribonuclease III [Clostridia bacterium]|nr:ribonuclease III [Clostridia bacterium]
MQNLNLFELEAKLGYKFKNIQYLETALTHSSYSNELKLKGKIVECNERLEFLGDSVLSIIAANYLFNKYPQSPEGELTRRRAVIVCRDALSLYAKSLNLGDFLFLGNGEEKNNARERKSLLENTFEALIGSIYLDGDPDRMEIIFNLVHPFFEAELLAWEQGKVVKDYKSELQQMIQQSGVDTLSYAIVGSSGPDHEKTFEVEARLNSNIVGRGVGKTKREAEQNAAKEALALFGEI